MKSKSSTNKYVLHPGYVRSRTDRDLHYISAARLAHLYHVPIRGSYIEREDTPRGARNYPENVVHLYPDYFGEYELKEK